MGETKLMLGYFGGGSHSIGQHRRTQYSGWLWRQSTDWYINVFTIYDINMTCTRFISIFDLFLNQMLVASIQLVHHVHNSVCCIVICIIK